MDKNLLKRFAIESKKDLTKKIETKIKSFFIDEKFEETQIGDIYYLTNNVHTLTLIPEDYKKRKLLIDRVNKLGLIQVIEEATFTWFNRIIALRYMEIHDYLPLTKNNESLGIRVLSSTDNTPIPEIYRSASRAGTPPRAERYPVPHPWGSGWWWCRRSACKR